VAQIGAPAPAHAQGTAPPPAERAHDYSDYERETIANVLGSLHASTDPAPEGKTIERIDIVPIDVFEERDPLPRWLNVLHATTRPSIIRHEMLLREGDRFSQVLCDDTLRNLRHLVQLSLVLVVATEGSRPGTVRVVVITKDVWSLRADWDLVLVPGGLEQLSFQPSEENVAGIHHYANGLFIMDPASITLGAGYEIPRIAGSRISMDVDPAVVVNRQSGNLEGSGASLLVGQPIYSGLTGWSWDASVAYSDAISRVFVNAAQGYYLDPATKAEVPVAYRARTYGAVYEVTRSLGWDVKHDITLGADVSNFIYRPAFTADARTTADFVAAYVPTNDARIGPFIQYHSYTKRYVRLIDFETLALQEDASLGHDVVLRAFPSFHALGATYDVLAIYAAAQYSWALRDGFVRVAFASTTEPQPDRIGNAAITPTARLVTPTVLGVGRLVADGMLLYRWRDQLNIEGACAGTSIYSPFAPCPSFLGGSNRLRGYPTNFFPGRDFAVYNLELRTRPIDVLSLEIGATAFYDSGGAFNGLGNLQTYQSVGVGIRALFPWLDREVFAADIGFPLERPIDPSTGAVIPPFGFIVSFGQAFDVPSVPVPSLLPTGQAAW
jgi:hypothetical protein